LELLVLEQVEEVKAVGIHDELCILWALPVLKILQVSNKSGILEESVLCEICNGIKAIKTTQLKLLGNALCCAGYAFQENLLERLREDAESKPVTLINSKLENAYDILSHKSRVCRLLEGRFLQAEALIQASEQGL
jgi:hypothetical protein